MDTTQQNHDTGRTNGIGTRQEKSLHAALKRWYAQPGDQLEVAVEGYLVDIVRNELLIEIQIRNFAAIKEKLTRLLASHPVRLVYPISTEKWIVRLSADGSTELGRRRSPKKGRVEDLFTELVRFPCFVPQAGFSLEVLLVRTEEMRRDDGRGSWRRGGWSLDDHVLLEVLEGISFGGPKDFLPLLPAARVLPRPFGTQELAGARQIPRHVAQKMVYCLRHMGLLTVTGKQGRSLLYQESDLALGSDASTAADRRR